MSKSKPTQAEQIAMLTEMVNKLAKDSKGGKGKAKDKPAKIYLEVGKWKGEDRILVYVSGKPIAGQFSKFQASFTRDTVRQLLDSDEFEEFANDE